METKLAREMYNLSEECRALIKYKRYIDEVMEELSFIQGEVSITKVREEYYGEIFNGYEQMYQIGDERFDVEIVIKEPIINRETLFTFVHEVGHVINKHLSGERDPLIKKQREIIANKYAKKKFFEWGIEIPDELKFKIEKRSGI